MFLCALMGLVAAIGTTWAMAWSHASTLFPPRSTEHLIVVTEHETWSMEHGRWLTGESVTLWYADGLYDSEWTWGVGPVPSRSRDRRRVGASEVPSWAGLHRPEHPVVKLHAIAYGWPMRCLWGRTSWWMEKAATGKVPIERHGWWVVAKGTQWDRSLPLRRVWMGVIGNAAFYGAVAWVAIAVPPVLIRRRRRRCGRCARCAYDVRGVAGGVCPECGTVLEV